MRRHFLQLLAALAGYSSIRKQASAAETRRIELVRADLTGTDMEIIVSVLEAPPGAVLAKHTHFGEEAVYILEGAAVQATGQAIVTRHAGAAAIAARGVPHAGFSVVGSKTLKLLNVHIVDKGKPLTTPAP